MNKKKLLLIGGGGHCRSVLDSVLELNTYSEIGIVDNTDCSCLGVSVVGSDEDLPFLRDSGWSDAFITVGSIGDTTTRRRLFELVKGIGFGIPVIVDPSSVVARDVQILEGSYVGKRAVVNTGAHVGICSIINTGAIVEHDCVVSSYVHISPGAVICGHVTVGEDTHIGAGSVLRQSVSIGSRCMIGAGSVVVSNVKDNVKAYGNPCRIQE